MVDAKPRLLSVDAAAKILGISAKTIRNRLGRKAKHPFPITPKYIGTRVLFDERDIYIFIDSLPTQRTEGD
jgi:hypothetical protein